MLGLNSGSGQEGEDKKENHSGASPGLLGLIGLDVVVPSQRVAQVSGRGALEHFKDCHVGL